MGAAIDRFLEFGDYVFAKEAWHVPLAEAVRDLTAAQTAWKPTPRRHSIWQIVDHLSLWKEFFTARLRGKSVGQPADWAKGRDWQEIADATEQRRQASVRRLMDAQTALRTEFAKLTDDDLTRPLPGSSSTAPLYTIFYTLLGDAEHDAYHCGQICYIRALQGIPAKASWDQE